MTDLFEHAAQKTRAEQAPLAERLRPQNLEDVVGQEKIVGLSGALRTLITKDQIPSMILWGPPGSGKTTLARVIAEHTESKFQSLSAVLSGVKDLRKAVEVAKDDWKYHQKKTIVFIDEIHRFNKAQQDALLPHLESGTITLIGATTENPSFEVIGPLLSRSRVFILEALQKSDLEKLLAKGLSSLNVKIKTKAQDFLLNYADGDGRRLLNTLEVAANLLEASEEISLNTLTQATQQKNLRYDKNGEEHYNIISAFIKSMRGFG